MRRIIGYYALILLIPRIKPLNYEIDEKGVLYIYYENQYGPVTLIEYIKLKNFDIFTIKQQQKIKKEIKKWEKRV